MRTAQIKRKTAETNIELALDLDGKGESRIDTGCGFLNHMLTLFARHALINLTVLCHGDTEVDFHHTTEDVGICLGDAFAAALGDKRGITRYGSCILPMDETLILSAVDISGRSTLVWNVPIPAKKVGGFDTELGKEFFAAFARRAELTLHVKKLDGENSHHILEAVFKSTARSLRTAVAIDDACAEKIPSTKGVL